MAMQVKLTPSQREVAGGLLKGISTSSILVLKSAAGMGRTTILNHVHEEVRGNWIGSREFLTSLINRTPDAIEEAFLETVEHALDKHDTVIIDDLHLIRHVVEGYDYPRQLLLDVVLTALLDQSVAGGKKLLLGEEDCDLSGPIGRRAQVWETEDFKAADYEALCTAYLPCEISSRLDYGRIHRFAPLLNVWQLKNACTSLYADVSLQTESFINYLGEHNITSNVEIEEVRPVCWQDLKGMDDVIRALETKIALPFENHTLADALNLKPRRGVLLAGPPGTGKTAIGRALAHRLKGKFFLIDGTAIAGTDDFYGTVQKIFEDATRNAPSVIFIDDTDVIFGGDRDRGL